MCGNAETTPKGTLNLLSLKDVPDPIASGWLTGV